VGKTVGIILFNKGKFMRIKDIPKIERPREKLISKGVDNLMK